MSYNVNLSPRVQKIRNKHQQLNSKSVEHMEDSRLSLDLSNNSSCDSPPIQKDDEDNDTSLTSSSPRDERETVQKTLLEERELLKEEYSDYAAKQEQQVAEDHDQHDKFRKKFQAVANAEMERIKQKMQDLTYEQDKFDSSIRSAWSQREEEKSQEIEQLNQNLTGVQEQLFVAKAKLKQRAYEDFLGEFCQSIDQKGQYVALMLRGLEKDDPHCRLQLQYLRNWSQRWGHAVQKLEGNCMKSKVHRHAISGDDDDDQAIPEISLTHSAEKCKSLLEDIRTIISNRKDRSHSSKSADIAVPTTSSPSSSSRLMAPLLTVEEQQALIQENQDQKSQLQLMEEKEEQLKGQLEQARAQLEQAQKEQ